MTEAFAKQIETEARQAMTELVAAAKLKKGEECLVGLYVDKSGRLCATMKVYHYLSTRTPYVPGDSVKGRVYEISGNFGVFLAEHDKYSALIPKKEVFEKYRINQPVYARVSQVLEDGRLSLSVKKKIPEQMEEDAEFILHRLEDADGFLPYHDKSAPEEIKAHFHMSKNAFKRAIGRLMKEGYITIGDDGIRMK